MNKFLKSFLSSGKFLPGKLKKLAKSQASDEEFFSLITSENIWSNTFETSIPIYRIHSHVHDFLDECEIKNGKAVAPDGKIRKVLFLGYDGMRADAAFEIASSKNAYNKSLESCTASFGGICETAKSGGLYLAYCGGETATSTQQSTSTSAGWIAQLTGTWGTENGVKENSDTKNLKKKTFLLEYAEKGLATSVSFDWMPFFETNLKEEIEYCQKNKNLSLDFINISPTQAKSDAGEIERLTKSSPFSGFAPADIAARDCALSQIEKDNSIVCSIYDSIDGAGHTHGFSPQCTQYALACLGCDSYTWQILRTIEAREKELNEKWLVILANDHGGKGKGHGGQSLQERTTWISTNIKMKEDYFAKDYNGKTRS